MFTGLFQPMHLLIILVIVMVIFGPGKLPDLGSSLGKAIRDFKKEMSEPETRPGGPPDVKRIEDKES
jgi:sec-independent protein translocase protein TatA